MWRDMERSAAIVVIGDEILSGKFADENAAFLIRELVELGVTLRRIAVIPDDLDDIAETVRRFSESYDFVVTSGGVGPTHDDITMAGIARGFDTQVVIHPDLEAILRAHWGETMPAANIRLAEVPDGADLVHGSTDGSSDSQWPAVCFRNVYILPGVPQLFRKKFRAIAERFRTTPTRIMRIYSRAEEGELAPHLDRTVGEFPEVKIGSYPRWGESAYQVIITLESKNQDALSRATASLSDRIRESVVELPEVVEHQPDDQPDDQPDESSERSLDRQGT